MNGATSSTQLCFNSTGVAVGTGNKNSVEAYFDTRFDIVGTLSGNIGWTADNAPSVNVRKGYVPGSHANKVDWCTIGNAGTSAGAVPGTHGGPPSATNTYYTYPSDRTGAKTTSASTSVTNIGTATDSGGNPMIVSGEPVVAAYPASPPNGQAVRASSNDTIQPYTTGASTATLTGAANATATVPSPNFVFEWTTAGLPEDTSFPAYPPNVAAGIEGTGNWDCKSYWTINHPGVARPTSITVPDSTTAVTGTCDTPTTTVANSFSRYQIYRYEIDQGTNPGGISDWSGANGWSTNGKTDAEDTPVSSQGQQQTENGSPYCAAASSVSGVDITSGGLDRRNIIVPFINCLAQTELGNLTGGNTAQNVPVAAFAKYFITQPYTALNDGNLYGEVTGPLTNRDGVTIYPLAQLYR
jgi:hypothetical protein